MGAIYIESSFMKKARRHKINAEHCGIYIFLCWYAADQPEKGIIDNYDAERLARMLSPHGGITAISTQDVMNLVTILLFLGWAVLINGALDLRPCPYVRFEELTQDD